MKIQLNNTVKDLNASQLAITRNQHLKHLANLERQIKQHVFQYGNLRHFVQKLRDTIRHYVLQFINVETFFRISEMLVYIDIYKHSLVFINKFCAFKMI